MFPTNEQRNEGDRNLPQQACQPEDSQHRSENITREGDRLIKPDRSSSEAAQASGSSRDVCNRNKHKVENRSDKFRENTQTDIDSEVGETRSRRLRCENESQTRTMDNIAPPQGQINYKQPPRFRRITKVIRRQHVNTQPQYKAETNSPEPIHSERVVQRQQEECHPECSAFPTNTSGPQYHMVPGEPVQYGPPSAQCRPPSVQFQPVLYPPAPYQQHSSVEFQSGLNPLPSVEYQPAPFHPPSAEYLPASHRPPSVEYQLASLRLPSVEYQPAPQLPLPQFQRAPCQAQSEYQPALYSIPSAQLPQYGLPVAHFQHPLDRPPLVQYNPVLYRLAAQNQSAPYDPQLNQFHHSRSHPFSPEEQHFRSHFASVEEQPLGHTAVTRRQVSSSPEQQCNCYSSEEMENYACIPHKSKFQQHPCLPSPAENQPSLSFRIQLVLCVSLREMEPWSSEEANQHVQSSEQITARLVSSTLRAADQSPPNDPVSQTG